MALQPLRTFAAIAARGLDPTQLVRLAIREISGSGRSFAGFALQRAFPELTGRQRFSVLNVASRAVRAGSQLMEGRKVKLGNVPVDPTLFGASPLGFRTEVRVQVHAPLFTVPGAKTETAIRNLNLGFDGIPTPAEIRAAAMGELVDAQTRRDSPSDPVDIANITADDIIIVSIVRKF